jgi:hypothetical protein
MVLSGIQKQHSDNDSVKHTDRWHNHLCKNDTKQADRSKVKGCAGTKGDRTIISEKNKSVPFFCFLVPLLPFKEGLGVVAFDFHQS